MTRERVLISTEPGLAVMICEMEAGPLPDQKPWHNDRASYYVATRYHLTATVSGRGPTPWAAWADLCHNAEGAPLPATAILVIDGLGLAISVFDPGSWAAAQSFHQRGPTAYAVERAEEAVEAALDGRDQASAELHLVADQVPPAAPQESAPTDSSNHGPLQSGPILYITPALTVEAAELLDLRLAPPCDHCASGWCLNCLGQAYADPAAWAEYGNHPAGRSASAELDRAIALDAARQPTGEQWRPGETPPPPPIPF